MKKIIIVILIFGFILGIFGFGYWHWNKNIYSKDSLKLEIIGPQEATIFEEVEYTVKYKNNGNIRLEEPRLIFEFPEYTLSADPKSEESFSIRQEIGPDEIEDIYPGQEKIIKFKGRIFGKEGEIKIAKVWFSYQPKNLKVRYESSSSFSTIIKSVPLTFDFDLSSKIEAGREFKFYLNYFSNLNYPLSNLGVKIEYPSDFEFLESKPRALEKTEWDIPVLNKAEGGRIEIKGRLLGESGNQKIFRAMLGVWQDNIFIPLKEITRGVSLGQPGLDIFQLVNGSDNYIASPGDLLHYEIFFRNISSEPFVNLFLVVKLEGKGFDLSSIKTDSGQVSKGDYSIVWDWHKVSKLSFLGQGEEGKVEFWVNLKNWQTTSIQEKNAVLRNSVLLSQTKEEFEIKMNSDLVVVQKVNYNDEVFGNIGPNPPKIGKTTTYTVLWEVKNYYNEVKNTTVRAVLPHNVKPTGKIYPETESSKFFFDNQSREIVWRIGDEETLKPGTGFLVPSPFISFQVALTPDSSQKGTIAQIIGEVKVKGEDQWTGLNIEGRDSAVDTTLPDDQFVSDHSGIVQ